MRTTRQSLLATGFCILVTKEAGAQVRPTLHVLMAGDTDDAKIGTAVESDLSAFDVFVGEAASDAGLSARATRLKGTSFVVSEVVSWVQGLQVAAADVVVFYYSGHGHRLVSTAERWPILEIGGQDLRAQWVIDALEQLKIAPRLVLVLVDSCNDVVDGAIGYPKASAPPSR